jgi:hypothetical protein
LIYLIQIANAAIVTVIHPISKPMSSFKKPLLTIFLIPGILHIQAQTGNRVFTGAQMTNFSTISLSTPAGKTWTTDRLATPGYFSATNGALYSNASDVNNIDGYVKKYGNQAFTFPVGTGTDLRTLAISAPAAITDAYATAWILGDPGGNLDPTGPGGGAHNTLTTTFPIYVVSKIGQWDWQAGIDMGNTGTGAGLTITVSMPDLTAFAVPVSLRLVGWNGTSWVDLSGWPTATGNTENSTITGTMIAGISAIGIGSTFWVLPLKLTSFTAREKDCGATLNWTSTNEENMDRFEIEQSNTANSYHKVGVVNAVGNNNESKYAFTTNQIESECYYRLKMIGKDGSFTYSPVEHVKINCKSPADYVTVYPNPVTEGMVFLNFTSESATTATLILNNDLGQQVKIKDVKLNKGSNSIKFEFGRLPKGIYFIQLISKENKTVFKAQKIIIE